jgi:polyvinyl alcohol dehydrogenase (cytochrome)
MRLFAMAVVVACLCAIVACSGDDDDNGASTNPSAANAGSLQCQWPMWGRTPARTFNYGECPTKISPTTVDRLTQQWFTKTRDVVTATPSVADGTIYVGDWSGRFYALALGTGKARWTFDASPHANVYSGQIVASAAIADVGKERLVFFASGKTMYALGAHDGKQRWKFELGIPGDGKDPTEIQSSPVVVDGKVLFGFDAHDQPGKRAGLIALDAEKGTRLWYFDPDAGKPATGCTGVWSSPSVDAQRGLVFAGSANCTSSPEGWGKYSEAIFAVDLQTGVPKWSYQPRGPSNLDFDFPGAPNLFSIGDREAVGLGGKDGIYYALDRDTGALLWKVTASTPRVQAKNFSTGGFIGAAAYDDGMVVGGTAIDGPCPCLHGIDVETGKLAWQQDAAAPTFAPSSIVNGVAFTGSTTDFTLRAVDAKTGAVLWSQQMAGGVAGGAVVSGDTVVAVAGIREPGVDPAGTESGVYAFRLGDTSSTSQTSTAQPTLPPSTKAAPPTTAPPNAPSGTKCIAQACTFEFTLKAPPAGTHPSLTVHLTPKPFHVDVRGDSLGDPNAWIRPGGKAATEGAVTFALFGSDDSLNGTLLCVLDADFDCVNDTLPKGLRPTYNRLSLLAIANTPVLPTAADGFDRLVTTESLDEVVSLG